jgi:NTE family protein
MNRSATSKINLFPSGTWEQAAAKKMTKISRIIFVFYLLNFCFSQASFAQIESARPKIGLALSGGGAKGFAHIGVLKVLEEIGMPVDYIAGTSMGAMVGALYAIGYSTAALDSLVTNIDWNELFSDSKERRYLTMAEKPWDARNVVSFRIRRRSVQLPAGLIAGQKISSLISRLTWSVHHVNDFTQFPIPFASVAVDIVTGETIRITQGFLPEALRASMAIPTIFTPIPLNEKLLVDGGLVRNLPAEDARVLGAEIVICVDVGAPLKKAGQLNSLLAILDQAVSLHAAHSTKEQRKLCDVLIAPEFEALGYADFDRADKIIESGEIAARENISQLLAIMDTLNLKNEHIAQPKFTAAQIDSIFINELTIKGLRRVSRGLVQAELGIAPQSWVSPAELDKAISRIYSSQFFERVTYKLQPIGNGMKLTVKVVEKEHDLFNFGVRYDSRNETSFLFNTIFRNLTGHGSALVLDLILANKTELDATYFVHTGWRPGLGVRLNGNINEQKLDRFEGPERAARLKLRTILGDIFLGNIFSTSYSIGAGLRGEITKTSSDIGLPLSPEPVSYISSAYGQLQIDTFDRTVFPRKGQQIALKFELAKTALGGNVDFRALSLDWHAYFSLHPKLSFLSRLQLGTVLSENLPLHKNFFLGGIDSFLGLKSQELSGQNLQALLVGVQFEFMKRRYILLRWNAGNVFETWRFKPARDAYFTGVGMTLGLQTRFGPVEYTFSSGNRRNSLTHLNLGFKF